MISLVYFATRLILFPALFLAGLPFVLVHLACSAWRFLAPGEASGQIGRRLP